MVEKEAVDEPPVAPGSAETGGGLVVTGISGGRARKVTNVAIIAVSTVESEDFRLCWYHHRFL